MDDHSTMRSQFAEVAVTPDIGEALKIGSLVFLAIRVIPEADRHSWEGFRSDQFSHFTELAKNTATDYEGARHGLMSSLGVIPIGHPVRPKEVADLVAFPVSQRAARAH